MSSKKFGAGYNYPDYPPPSSKPVFKWDPENPASFLELVDTFNSYTGHAGKFLIVNATESGITLSAAVGGDLSYIHTQAVASDEWNVVHGLGKNPSVAVFNHAGKYVLTRYSYTSLNELKIYFGIPTSGYAYIN